MIDEKIKNLVERSGIITHYKTIDILRKKDWKAVVAPYYYDNVAGSVKEVDIIAEKMISCVAQYPDESKVQIVIQLFLECKYVDQEIIFWFDDIDKNKAVSKLESETGLNIRYDNKTSGDIGSEKFHYLIDKKSVKLFSANVNKADVIYKAINQVLNAQNYWNNSSPLLCPFSNYNNGYFKKIIKYPVIVCDNFTKLIEVELQNNGKYSTKKIDNKFLIETNYICSNEGVSKIQNSYSLIDVVNLNYLGIFLNEIENEVTSLLDPYKYKSSLSQWV